jgi:hypothetical protein
MGALFGLSATADADRKWRGATPFNLAFRKAVSKAVLKVKQAAIEGKTGSLNSFPGQSLVYYNVFYSGISSPAIN